MDPKCRTQTKRKDEVMMLNKEELGNGGEDYGDGEAGVGRGKHG